MRRRSPAAVQKWVDSIPSNSSSDQSETTEKYNSNAGSVNTNNDNSKPSKSDDMDDSKNNNPKKNESPSAERPPNKHLSIFNKGKISELYQKLDLNKKRYNLLKPKSIEKLDKLKTTNLNQVTNKMSTVGISKTTDSQANAIKAPTQDAEEMFEFDDNLDIVAATSTPDENPIKTKHSDSQLRQRMRMSDIGRSFSENRANEMDDNFQINERNNSCPNEIPNMDGRLKKMDNFNICSSIQNCDSTCDRFNNDNVLAARSFSFSDRQRTLFRDNSVQSDSSHCSSVESLLESRKPDPESILINLGFGPIETEDVLSKIPKR